MIKQQYHFVQQSLTNFDTSIPNFCERRCKILKLLTLQRGCAHFPDKTVDIALAKIGHPVGTAPHSPTRVLQHSSHNVKKLL